MTSRSRERGQVAVIFALAIPMIFAMGAVVLDVGNWYVHKRHLQSQVDAAALAAGNEFAGCFQDPVAANSAVRDEALRYAGDTLRDPATANRQVQQPDDVRVTLNSARFWAPANLTTSPANGYGLDWTMDGNPLTPGRDSSQPCDARFLDVKATDDDAPLLWGLLPLSASPKASAKVEIRKAQSMVGMLPFAVPEANPRSVVALFVDQTATNAVLDWAFLTGPSSPTDTVVRNGQAVALWRNTSAQILPGVVNQTGIIVLATRRLLTDQDLQGRTLSDICSIPTSSCFAGTTNTSGVLFIRGTTLTDGQVTLLDAELSSQPPPSPIPVGNPTPCFGTDPHSEPYYLWNADCNLRIRAEVDFGNLAGPGNEVRLNGGNNCNGGTLLQDSNGQWFESPYLPSIGAESGRTEFRLCWRAAPNNQATRGNFGNQVIQMTYAAPNDRPLVYSAVRPTGCLGYSNALPKAAATVCVEVGLEPPLRVTPPSDPPIYVRVAHSQSLNQMVDCDAPNRQPEDEIRDGCLTPYQVNRRDLQCAPLAPNNLPPSLPPPDPNPIPDCVEANPGQVTSMARGLRQRFEDPPPIGAGCPPNRWNEYRMTGVLPPRDDPRVVRLFVAEYGEFDSQGIKPVPITRFAYFYITGWFTKRGPQGQLSNTLTNGCPDNDPPPTPPFCPRRSTTPCADNDSAVEGAVWGYYHSAFDGSSDVLPGPELCAFSELSACVAVLVE